MTVRPSALFAASAAIVAFVAVQAAAQPRPEQTRLTDGCAFWVDPDQAQIEAVNEGLPSGVRYLGTRYGTGNARPAADFVLNQVLGWDDATGEFAGVRPWQPMEIVDFRADPSQRQMTVDRVTYDGDDALLGCAAELRQYVVEGVPHDRPIAPSMWFEPGDALSLSIRNDLVDPDPRLAADGTEFGDTHGNHGKPASSSEFGYIAPLPAAHAEHDMSNAPPSDPIYNMIHDLNHTNIHTHGWHVDPKGNSDNVFVNIGPGDTHAQFVELPLDHPSGTHWFHAHKHGATAVQVSGGMAGTLIVTDESKGLDTVPVVAGATDMLMALQQIPYDDQGEVEGIHFIQEDVRQTDAVCDAGANLANRPIFVNGVAAPTIQVRLGEVQRWRFVHTGSINDLNPQVVAVSGMGLDTLSQAGMEATNLQANGTPQTGQGAPSPDYDPITLPLYEIATDGLPTGQIIPKANLSLSPAYRSDALFQVTQAQIDALQPLVGRDQITRLYLVSNGQDQSGTSTPKQCVRDEEGRLVLDDGAPLYVQPAITSARRVMAVIEILPEEYASDVDLARDYDSPEMTEAFAAARADYEAPGWGTDPAAPYDGIGPLAPITDEELTASGQAHPDSNAVEIVHYFGDAPNAAGRTKYFCPLSGGDCTYCGGSTAEFTGDDGQIYSFTTALSDAEVCTATRPAPTDASIGSDPDDPYRAEDQVPLINFMICDGFEETTLAPVKGEVQDPDGNTISGTPESVGYDGTASVWSCFEFTEESDYVRDELLNSSNSWRVSSNGNAGHVFHIHVNPFNLAIPEGTDFFGNPAPAHSVWKDTYKAPATGNGVLSAQGQVLTTRYTVFSGAYVQHCHILTHEDQGMMQVVSVTDRTALERLTARLGLTDTQATRTYLSELVSLELSDVTSGADLPQVSDVIAQ